MDILSGMVGRLLSGDVEYYAVLGNLYEKFWEYSCVCFPVLVWKLCIKISACLVFCVCWY